MANTQAHVGVEVGEGLVARFGDAVLLVVEPGVHRDRAEDLLGAVEAAATEADTSRADTSRAGASQAGASQALLLGESLAYRLAIIVAGYEPGTVPPFGAVAPLGEGYVVLLHGRVSAELSGPLGVVQLSGDQAVTWVDYKVEVSLDRLSVTSGDHPVQVDPMSDLRAGLVPANGFVLTPARSADDHQATSARASAPITLEPEPRGRGDAGKDQVRAAQRSSRATAALGAPVGHLVATDGMRIPLDRAYVLGREPEADPAVTSGAATPVRLADDENLISRVHSYITVEAGEVSLKDASSANGTFVAAPGDENWAQVGDEPTVLPPAWSMRVGNQVFTYVAASAEP